MVSPPDTVKSAVRKFWKDFLPAWLVPVVMAIDTVRHEITGIETSPLVVNSVMVLFFLSFAWWARLYMTKEISYRHAAALGMLTPFALWVIFVLILNIVLRLF